MSINRVVITGNLTRDSEVRFTASQCAVLSFSVAVNDRRYNAADQAWEDYTNYFDCTMFGVRAEKIGKFLPKGTRVAVEGKLRWSSWEKDGQKRSKVEIIVEEIVFLSARSYDDGRDAGGQGSASQSADLRAYGLEPSTAQAVVQRDGSSGVQGGAAQPLSAGAAGADSALDPARPLIMHQATDSDAGGLSLSGTALVQGAADSMGSANAVPSGMAPAAASSPASAGYGAITEVYDEDIPF